MHFDLTSADLLSASFALRSSRAAFRPSAAPNSATSALMSGLDVGSIFPCAPMLPAAKLSWSSPQSPLGSPAVTAIPAIVTLSSSTVHSSGVKFDLSVIGVAPLLAELFASEAIALRMMFYLPFILHCTYVQWGQLPRSEGAI